MDVGRLAGVAWISPIGVPARLDRLDERDVERRAGRDATRLGDEGRLNMRGSERLARRAGGDGNSREERSEAT